MEKKVSVDKAQQDLDAVEYVPPVLLPTKDVEIATKRAEIEQAQIDHAAGESYILTRAQYIAIVQPLKNELYTLIAENETIATENRSRTEAAQTTYQEARAPYELILSEKQVELNALTATIDIPLNVLENSTYAIVEDFDAGGEKPLKVQRTVNEVPYSIWCYVTEDVKEAYVGGSLQIGDVVIVIFVDRDINKPLVQQKVFKSWI